MCRMTRILSALVSKDQFAVGAGMQLGVGEKSFHASEQVRLRKEENKAKEVEWLANLRIYVEIDLIAKYPEMCEVWATTIIFSLCG